MVPKHYWFAVSLLPNDVFNRILHALALFQFFLMLLRLYTILVCVFIYYILTDNVREGRQSQLGLVLLTFNHVLSGAGFELFKILVIPQTKLFWLSIWLIVLLIEFFLWRLTRMGGLGAASVTARSIHVGHTVLGGLLRPELMVIIRRTVVSNIPSAKASHDLLFKLAIYK